MKKEKSKKAAPKVNEDPRLKFVSVDDNIKKNNRQAFRLEVLVENDEAFQEIENQYKAILKSEKKLYEWDRYVNCDKVPVLDSPKNIRTYLYKWKCDEMALKNSTFNWLLNVDERSVLTQDIDGKDLTRTKIKENACIIVDADHVKNGIRMVSGLQELLELKSKEELQYFDDLLKVKDEVRNRIRSSIDFLTYYILFNAEGNMDSIDSISAKFCIEMEPFTICIWALKNVPYNLKTESTELSINFQLMDTSITLPFYATCDNLVLRGLHEKFDHRSVYGTSFKLPASLPPISDLKSVLKEEWTLRKEIETNQINEMKKNREDYEEEIRLREEEAKKAEANRKKADKNGKKNKPKKQKKLPSEPPMVDNNTFLDVEKDFIEMNDKAHAEFMKLLRPEVLNLSQNEINLREYIILGGIYEFNFLEKPDQLWLPNFCTNLEEKPEILRYRAFECNVEYEKPLRDLHSAGLISVSNDLNKTNIVFEELQPGDVKLGTLMKVTVQLPHSLCRWCRPITCRWSSKPDLILAKAEERSTTLFTGKIEPDHTVPYPVKDIDLLSRKDRNYLHYITVNQLIPRMDSLHRFPDEVDEEKEKLAAMERELERFKMEADLDFYSEAIAEGVDAISAGTKQSKYSEKVRAEAKPPMTLFPRNVIVRPIEWIENYNQFALLESSDEKLNISIDSLSEKDRTLLSEYLKQLSDLQAARQPYFLTWWAIMMLLIKVDRLKPKVDLPPEELTDKTEFPDKEVKGKHGKKSGKKGKTVKLEKSSTKASLPTTKSTSATTAKESTPPVVEKMEENNNKINEENNNVIPAPAIEEKNETKRKSDRKPGMKLTDGIFGFAFKRYLHFPFKSWALYPDEKIANKVIFEIMNEFARFYVNIEKEGYTASVLVGSHVYAKITTPVADLRNFIEQMKALGLNIFTERDTSFYVKHVSEKHICLEFHTYQSLCQFCLLYKFSRSKWNCLAHRRVLVLKFGKTNEQSYEFETVQITPEESQCCTVTERCTGLDEVVLDYAPTRRNKKFEPDLFSLLVTCTVGPVPHCPKVEVLVNNILRSVRPLTFCQ